MATRAQKMKVGVFLLSTTLLFAVLLATIAGYRRVDYEEYYVMYSESILGLQTDGLVQYVGVPVGKVKNIYVDDKTGGARVNILVDPAKVTLKKGVEAKLEIYSLATGTMCIGLYGGDGPLLPEGTEIPARESAFASITSELGGILEDVNGITEILKSGLEGMESGELAETIRGANDVLVEIRDGVNEVREVFANVSEDVESGVEEARAGIENFTELTESLTELSDTAQETLATVQAKIEPIDLAELEGTLTLQLTTVSEQLQMTAETLDHGTQSLVFGTRNVEQQLSDTLEVFDEAVRAIRDLAEYLRDNPSSLVYPTRAQEDEE